MLVVTNSSATSVSDRECVNGGTTPTSALVRCAGCGGSISDRYYLLAVDRQWHLACLTCSQCKVQLDSELTCYARGGLIYCKEDYFRLFSSKRCTRCHLSISPNELVMRAREHIYHLHCFTCATCNKPLTKGEYFGLRGDIIYCRSHYEVMLQYESPPSPVFESRAKGLKHEDRRTVESNLCAYTDDPPSPSRLQHCSFQTEHSLQKPLGETSMKSTKGRPKKLKTFFATSLLSPLRNSLITSDDLCSLNSNPSPSHHQQQTPPQHPQSSNSACGGTAGSDSSTSSEQHTILSRPKRMRTSFKHHQLRAMKSYFSINHNPDAKDLKQLSQKTGLSKRVLQVWFQNARAKWRRNLLRQRSQGPEIAQDCKPLSELTSQSRFCDALRLGSLIDIQPTQITQEEQNIQTFTNLI